LAIFKVIRIKGHEQGENISSHHHHLYEMLSLEADEDIFECFICFSLITQTALLPCCAKYACFQCLSVLKIYKSKV